MAVKEKLCDVGFFSAGTEMQQRRRPYFSVFLCVYHIHVLGNLGQ